MAKEPGLTLLDVGVVSEQVEIGGKQINVFGISAESILSLFQRFPELQKLISGGGIKPADMIKAAPPALAAIIAAGCGNLGDEDAETVAAKLPIEVQLDILEVIGRLTFRSGFGPFVKRITALAESVASANSGKAQDTNSQPQSSPSSRPGTKA